MVVPGKICSLMMDITNQIYGKKVKPDSDTDIFPLWFPKLQYPGNKLEGNWGEISP